MPYILKNIADDVFAVGIARQHLPSEHKQFTVVLTKKYVKLLYIYHLFTNSGTKVLKRKEKIEKSYRFLIHKRFILESLYRHQNKNDKKTKTKVTTYGQKKMDNTAVTVLSHHATSTGTEADSKHQLSR